MATLGEAIRHWREKRGLSMYELGRRANVQTSTLTELESGKQKSMRADRLQRIAAALGVTTDELVHIDEGAPRPSRDLPGSRLEEWTTEIVAIGPNLTPAQRAAVLEHARALHASNGR